MFHPLKMIRIIEIINNNFELAYLLALNNLDSGFFAASIQDKGIEITVSSHNRADYVGLKKEYLNQLKQRSPEPGIKI